MQEKSNGALIKSEHFGYCLPYFVETSFEQFTKFAMEKGEPEARTKCRPESRLCTSQATFYVFTTKAFTVGVA
jgi:hypothetical protein